MEYHDKPAILNNMEKVRYTYSCPNNHLWVYNLKSCFRTSSDNSREPCKKLDVERKYKLKIRILRKEVADNSKNILAVYNN